MTATPATPAKLRDGTWGARVQGTARRGQQITITTRRGKSWDATVQRVLWSGDGVTLVATASGVSTHSHGRRRSRCGCRCGCAGEDGRYTGRECRDCRRDCWQMG